MSIVIRTVTICDTCATVMAEGEGDTQPPVQTGQEAYVLRYSNSATELHFCSPACLQSWAATLVMWWHPTGNLPGERGVRASVPVAAIHATQGDEPSVRTHEERIYAAVAQAWADTNEGLTFRELSEQLGITNQVARNVVASAVARGLLRVYTGPQQVMTIAPAETAAGRAS